MRTYDFSPFYRSIVGFDRMASMIDAASKLDGSNAYPPYNIEQLDEDTYRIELAVAGFGEGDLNIESHQNTLTISGKRGSGEGDNDNRTFLHRGIAERGFERRFQLADHVVVAGADLSNGLLTIELRRELPEALKPRTIEIGAGSKKLIPGKSKSKKAA